jgi:hypothetical protein
MKKNVCVFSHAGVIAGQIQKISDGNIFEIKYVDFIPEDYNSDVKKQTGYRGSMNQP